LVLLADAEFAELQRQADSEKLPPGTLAYRLVARGLARRNERASGAVKVTTGEKGL
jgi:hypothetical protein